MHTVAAIASAYACSLQDTAAAASVGCCVRFGGGGAADDGEDISPRAL